MPKIVYNACYGGFSLSRAAVLRAREISGNPHWGCTGDYDPMSSELENIYLDSISRHDPTLVAVVEELEDDADGAFADLRIRELPNGSRYRIDEYDGNESVMTPEDYKWIEV